MYNFYGGEFMKKKLIIIISSVILFFAVGVTAGIGYAQMNTPKHPSDYHIGITYNEALNSDKPMLILFYADWCGYCLRFMPKFQTLSKLYGNKYNFVMLNVEGGAENIKLTQNTGIAGYPTVYILDPKYDNKVLISNTIYQDLGKFRTELDRYLRIRALLDSK